MAYIHKETAIDIFNARADMAIGTPKQVFQAAAKMIEALPDADVKEEKRGAWTKTEEPLGWQEVTCGACSACGESWVCEDNFTFDDLKQYWNYCPSCGAKMDEPAQETKEEKQWPKQ